LLVKSKIDFIVTGDWTMPGVSTRVKAVLLVPAWWCAIAVLILISLFTSLESVQYMLRAERDNIRPSDWVENATGVERSGQYLRNAHEILLGLSKGMDQLPKHWVDRYEKSHKNRGMVRKAVAAIDALATMVGSARKAETSSAKDKLLSMSELIKDVKALVKVNPAVKQYIDTMVMSIEGIATSAAVIEAARCTVIRGTRCPPPVCGYG
jgi:hypothetical protein